MYINHFGFSELAFQRASDPDQFFRSEEFGTTRRALHEGIRCDYGLMLLTGESGVGKTAVVQLLERELTGKTDFVAFDRRLFDVDGTESDGERNESPTVDGIEDLVFRRLVEASRRRPDPSVPMLAVVDDAHMGSAVELMGLLWGMARLRAGANGTDRPGLLLVGNAELAQRFWVAPLRGLKRDVRLQRRMAPLPLGQLHRYIRFHLERAGYRGEALFSDAAVACVEQYSRGIPRLINNICGMALVIAAEDDVHQVTEAIVRDAASDLLIGRQTLEAAAPIDALLFDEEPVPAIESDTHRVDIPKRFEDLDLWPDEADSVLFVDRPGDEGASSHVLELSAAWLRSRADRAWRGVKRTRQRLVPHFRSARGLIEQRLRKLWRDARVEQRWGSYLIWISHRSEHAWAAVRHARERLPRNAHSVLARLKRLREKPLRETEAGQPGSSTLTSAWWSTQRLSQMWQLGAPVAFSSVMAVFAIVIWTLVLTHGWSMAPDDERNPNDVVATRTETSMAPVKSVRAREKAAQERTALMTLEEAPYEHALIAMGAVLDDGKTGAYQVAALTSPESWSNERAAAPRQESASENAGEPKNREPANPSIPGPERPAVVSQENAESGPGAVQVSMTSNPEIPPHTSKAQLLSAIDTESRVTTAAVTEPKVSSRAPDELHEAGSGDRGTRTSLDHQLAEKIYVVASGDSLWSISRHHKMTIGRLRSINGLSDKHVIQPGQSLHVESGADQVQSSDAWHTVRLGENLFRIGQRYGISVTEIKALNSLTDPSRLKVGQRLRVSAAAPAKRQASEKRAATQAASQG